jgi:hypothetical protein
MRLLIAIVTCHRFKERADAQRATWIKDTKIDYKFFLGLDDSGRKPDEDEVFLTVPDDYPSLPLKVRAVMQWAREHGYDAVLKCDDDTWIRPDRLVLPTVEWAGRINRSSKNLCPRGWCSGYAYWLIGSALQKIADAPTPSTGAEDVWVGKTLNDLGYTPQTQPGFVVLSIVHPKIWHTFRDSVVATCEFPAGKMFEIHNAMHSTATPEEIARMNPRLGKRVMQFGEVLRRRR